MTNTLLVPRGGIIEADFETELRSCLRKLGVATHKNKGASGTVNGRADFYAIGGNWVEVKVERRVPSYKVTPISNFVGLQRKWLDDIQRDGDNSWAAVLWDYDKLERRMMVVPWYYARRIILWPLSVVHHFTESYSGKESVERYCRDHLVRMGRMSDRDFTDRFNSWPHRDNESYFKMGIVVQYNDSDFTSTVRRNHD